MAFATQASTGPRQRVRSTLMGHPERPSSGGRRLSQLARLPAAELRGVGEARAKALAKVDLHPVLDLLTHYPRRYLDRTKEARLADLVPGEEAMVLARVRSISAQPTRTGRRMGVAEAPSGTASLKVPFFTQPFRERQPPPATEAVLFGKLEVFRGR